MDCAAGRSRAPRFHIQPTLRSKSNPAMDRVTVELLASVRDRRCLSPALNSNGPMPTRQASHTGGLSRRTCWRMQCLHSKRPRRSCLTNQPSQPAHPIHTSIRILPNLPSRVPSINVPPMLVRIVTVRRIGGTFRPVASVTVVSLSNLTIIENRLRLRIIPRYAAWKTSRQMADEWDMIR